MNRPIYHETKSAVYFDNCDGSLTVKRKQKTKVTQTLAVFKNDPQGHAAYRRFRRALVDNGNRVYTMYRCPNDGRSYDEIARNGIQSKWFLSRRGHVPKKFAKVLTVLRSNYPR
jgi:hypothetical protein